MSVPEEPGEDPPEDPRVEALLAGLVGPTSGPPPDWIAHVDAWIMAAVVAWPQADQAVIEACAVAAGAFEALGRDRFALAWSLRAAPVADPAGTAVAVQAIRALVAAAPTATVALTAGPGRCTPTAVLGDAPEAAGALFRSARGPGWWVGAEVRPHVDGVMTADGHGFRVERQRRRSARPTWVAAGLGVLVAAAILVVLALRPAPAGPAGHIFVTGERTERGADAAEAGDTIRADRVQVVVDGQPGTYASLLVLDSEGHFKTTDEHLQNRRFDAAGRLQGLFVVEGPAGRERFLALISQGPQPDLDALLAEAGAHGGDRDARVAALRVALARVLGPNTFTVVEATEVQHGP